MQSLWWPACALAIAQGTLCAWVLGCKQRQMLAKWDMAQKEESCQSALGPASSSIARCCTSVCIGSPPGQLVETEKQREIMCRH